MSCLNFQALWLALMISLWFIFQTIDMVTGILGTARKIVLQQNNCNVNVDFKKCNCSKYLTLHNKNRNRNIRNLWLLKSDVITRSGTHISSAGPVTTAQLTSLSCLSIPATISACVWLCACKKKKPWAWDGGSCENMWLGLNANPSLW